MNNLTLFNKKNIRKSVFLRYIGEGNYELGIRNYE